MSLQPQLHPDDDIYLIDSSRDRSGVKIANLYGTSRCYIFVEVGDYSFDKSVEFGKQSAKENKQIPLVLFENSVISATFIQNYKRSIRRGDGEKPAFLKTPYPKIPPDFQWYCPSLKDEVVVLLPFP